MMRIRMRFAAAIAALAAMTSTGNADNLIVNGSFEMGNYTSPGFVRVFVGDHRITGWDVGGLGVDWHVATPNPALNPNLTGPHFGPAADGSLVIDLNLDGGNSGTGTIQQTFLTVPGHTYHVSFRMAASNFFLNPRPVLVQVANGAEVANFPFQTFASPQYGMVWTTFTFAFVAGSGSNETTLRFASPNGSGFWGPLLDDVQVYPADATKPAVILCLPLTGNAGLNGFELEFSEPVDARRGALAPSTYQVVSSGPDGLFGTPDDRDYPVALVEPIQTAQKLRVSTSAPVPTATPLRLTARRTGIYDIYGNSMAEDFVRMYPQGPRAPRSPR